MDNFSNGLYFLQVGEHLKKTFKLLKPIGPQYRKLKKVV